MRSKLVPILLNNVPGWVRSNYGLLVPSVVTHYDEGRAWVQGFGNVDPTALITTVRASVGYAATSAGGLNLFPANVPRITDLGLLVEQAATNLALQSQTFTNSTWVKANASVSGTTTAPDGTSTALKLVESAATSTHLVNQTIGVSNGTSYTTSIYFKAAERTWAYIQWNDLASGFPRAWINLSTGALGTVQAGLTATVTAAANGFYRLNVVGNSNGAAPGSAVISFGATTGDGVVSYAGDGTSGIYLWQADLVAASAAASPIATTTVAVTRAADSIKSAINLNLPQPYSTAISMGGLPALGADLVNWGSTVNGAGLYVPGSPPRVWVAESSVTTANVATGAVSVNTAFKMAARYATNNVNGAVGGTIGTADTSSIPPNLTTFGFGISQVNFQGNYPNAYIKRLTIFSSGLSDAQLQALST